MIRVSRAVAAHANAALAATNKSGLSELECALWYYSDIVPDKPKLPKKPRAAPKFSAYRDQRVKDALISMFGGRCAYCESSYDHTGPMDVEHYRPKGGYLDENGKLRKPGYFWLAADWNNLLPSCRDCNGERNQVRRIDGALVKSKSGKANKFPLAAGSPRATGPAGIQAEVPLLLNPCNDNPQHHLIFREDGFVEPAADAHERSVPKGMVTIDVCGLDRVALIAQRRSYALRLASCMRRVLECDGNIIKYPADMSFVSQHTNALKSLNDLCRDSDYQALTQGLAAFFRLLQAATIDYFQAVELWRASPVAVHRQCVITTIAKLKRFFDPAAPFSDLARRLIPPDFLMHR